MTFPKAYVLDCSVTLAWVFEDEATALTNQLLAELHEAEVLVPGLWHLELANVLTIAIRHKRINERHATQFLDRLLKQQITTDSSETARAFSHLRSLAGKRNLTVYDAAYLDLALRTGLPLATLDGALCKAARAESVALVLQ